MNIILCLWGENRQKIIVANWKFFNFETIPMVIKMIPNNINKYIKSE